VFLFSSELNTLKNQLTLTINDDTVSQFIRTGYFYKSFTPYKNVHELQAGHYAHVQLHDPVLKQVQWWRIHDFYNQRSTDCFELASQNIDNMLHRAVKNRVESSDLEVGSFLSGGIDSGLVTAIAKQYNSSLKTFTVSFEGEYDEAPLAKLVAQKYNTDHYEIKISFVNLLNDIEKILSNYGEPFYDSSAVPSYYVSQAARKHLTVILNGDGGDEIFAGYRRYVPFSKYDFFKASRFTRGVAKLTHNIMPATHNKKSKYNYFYRLADLARKNNLEVYLSSSTDVFEGYEKKLRGNSESLQKMRADFEQMNRSGLSGLQKIMNLDFDNILAGVLLVKMDIATMAHSLEGRSPLLCKELLEYVPGLSDSYKIKGVQTKYLLRKLAGKYLPAELINQPKRGFEPPQKRWVNNELKPMIGDYVNASSPYFESFIDKKFIQELFDNKVKMPAEKRSKILWLVFALEVWHKKVYSDN
ncbi:MAG TPA: asparagine synthase C-terminal domain-containing protein, partial [Chitinophagaceae bacterium]|nr:asparagine synthase C-terminal domain-containing protein [Chitinophagaceae bacterium]